MKLIVVRHGETTDNKKKISQGQQPGKLNLRGLLQSRKVAKRLKDEHFDIIYCSDLRRVVQTLKPILRYHKKTPVHYVKELRERSFGEFEGRKWEELGPEWEAKKKENHNPDWLPKGAESREQVEKRFLKFFKKMEKEHFGKTILWMTHGGGVRAVLKILYERTGIDYGNEKPPNTSVTMIEIDEDKNHHVHVVNCAKHL
ncbi:MAG: histidine phosphatase family protein [Candidatus Woesearchaeota archaeon]